MPEYIPVIVITLTLLVPFGYLIGKAVASGFFHEKFQYHKRVVKHVEEEERGLNHGK